MKLVNFQANNVYNQFDFNIDFFSNITILYGINGCGKTTVLQMLNLIISGKFFELGRMQFDQLILKYSFEGEEYFLKISKEKKIEIESNHKIINEILNNTNFNSPSKSRAQSNKRHNIIEKFNEIFNAIFISIERKVQKSIISKYPFERDFYDYVREHYKIGIESIPEDDLDDLYKYFIIRYRRPAERRKYEELRISGFNPIDDVINLISNKFREFQKYCSKLDHQYQQESYKKMISLKKIDEIRKKLLEFNGESIVKAKERIFNQSTYFMEEIEIPEEKDFERLIKNFENEKKKVEAGKDISGDYLLNFIQFIKLDESAILLETNNKKKEEKQTAFKLLIDNLNDFFSDTKKKAILDDENIKFELRNKEIISPHNLSSGEKQILIFFTYLIFNEHDNFEPVILYDEPDLSLHLEWQEKFIESILKINPTIQIILATHSPGIGSEKFEKNYISLEDSFINE